jgi:hypothetical protein
MPKSPPPMRPLAVSIVVSRLHVIVPVAAVAALALVLTPGLALLLLQPPPGLLEAPREQRWTADTGNVASLAWAALRGVLPPPDPRQKRAPCDPEVGEEDIGGVCWIRLAVEKCPAGKAFPHNGKCYWRALRPEPLPREPTSGDGRPLGVADP